ncbi:hypothetical protein BN903_237 [Halorubrum sp. AJ67]|nr:hypothetical protein BN903_237 [Halorubrum sp. AJ67]
MPPSELVGGGCATTRDFAQTGPRKAVLNSENRAGILMRRTRSAWAT